MHDTGEVPRQFVLDVLRANGVDVTETEIPDGFLLAKDDRVEHQHFPDHVSKRMLQYLHYHFHVPIHQFYNPQQAATGTDN